MGQFLSTWVILDHSFHTCGNCIWDSIKSIGLILSMWVILDNSFHTCGNCIWDSIKSMGQI